ncbi:MAG TPA: trypsin-like peptidase domain-containing protein [Pyrinomonadaceae bacterium]|jgi:S1-C subfamily serine protease|nr:trypsin-like peptidase domain-containing protein [Pyrinomonadaceae bacterium]
MTDGLVIHIANGLDKHTEVLMQDRILIGASEDCNLRINASLLPANGTQGVLLELGRKNGYYRVTDFDPTVEITHNGARLENYTRIDDGDEVRIGPSKLLLTFFPLGGLPAVVSGPRTETHVAPFIQHAAIESAATARRDDAKVFLREFTRELVREINPSTKLVTLAIALALVGGVLYIGFSLYREVQTSRRVIDAQNEQLAKLSKELGDTSRAVNKVDESNKMIRDSLSLAPKLRSDYGNGVCLISGSYVFVERGTGRPLRYPEVQTNEDGVVIQNGADPLQLTPEGNGAVAEFEFVGTGFHVGDGFILTNRHVAQPWLADERAQSLTSTASGMPRLKKLMAFFPESQQPLALKYKQSSQTDDLAVCLLENKDQLPNIPVLPLDRDSDAVAVGKAVVMMGYPSGPDRLLALLDDAEARSIQARYGASLESLLGYLAEKNHIQPLTTQGHITDLDTRRIVYDARTAEGGSGAPLFGQSGRVIGVNFAVFTENTASNFAVPVRYGITLLGRAGWKPPEGTDGNSNENANGTVAGTRSGSTTSNAPR